MGSSDNTEKSATRPPMLAPHERCVEVGFISEFSHERRDLVHLVELVLDAARGCRDQTVAVVEQCEVPVRQSTNVVLRPEPPRVVVERELVVLRRQPTPPS